MPERQSREKQDDPREPGALDALEALRDAVRAKAKERTWSQGITLTRDGRVASRRAERAALEFEVRVPARPAPFEVVLHVADGEWECSCDSREAVCSHVVAAVLSALDAAKQGTDVPDGAARGLAAIRYLLSPVPGGIAVDRVLVRHDQLERLTGSLLSLVAAGQ